MTESAATSGEVQILIAIAELKGSLQTLQNVDKDHETRIRTIEGKPIPDAETEKRLRTIEAAPTPDLVTEKRLRDLEDRRTISPGQLWRVVLGVAAVLSAAAGIYAAFPH